MSTSGISKAKILSSYIEYPLPKDKISKEAFGIADLILSTDSSHPISKPDKPKLEGAYIISSQQAWGNRRGGDFTGGFNKGKMFERMPATQPEEQIKISIDNIFLFNKTLSFPLDQPAFYIRNKQINNNFGPVTSAQLKDYYTTNQINANNTEFRLIDIYSFKNMKLFTYIPLSSLNDEKWIDNIMDNPLIQYTTLFRTTQNLVECQPKDIMKKKSEKEKEKVTVSKEKESVDLKENVTKETSKESPKEIPKQIVKEQPKPKEEVVITPKHDIEIEETFSSEEVMAPKKPLEINSYIIAEDDDKWEDPNKKKRKVRPGQKDNTPKQLSGIQSQKKEDKTPTLKAQGTPVNGGKEVVEAMAQKYKEKETNSGQSNEKDPNEDDGFEIVSNKKKKQQKKRPTDTKVSLGFKY